MRDHRNGIELANARRRKKYIVMNEKNWEKKSRWKKIPDEMAAI